MGWFNDDFPGHDGYMVGVEHDAEHGDYREFSRQSLPDGWKDVILAERDRLQRVPSSVPIATEISPTILVSAEGCSATSAESVDLAPSRSPTRCADLTVPLRFVAMGCECGWRSPRLHAPMGLVYVAFEVEFESATDGKDLEKKRHDDFEKSMIALWAAHLHQAPIEPENIRLPSEYRRRS